MSDCVCPQPGYCPRHRRRMVGRTYEHCSGICPPERPCLSEQDRAKIIGQLRPTAEPSGPGTELRKMLASLGLTEAVDGGCPGRADRMDAWGPEGCREHLDEILAPLRKAYAELGWAEWGKAAARAAAHGLAFKVDWRDPAPGLVMEAIRRAELRISPIGNKELTS